MTANKTARIQHDTPTKNRFIGAMEATGKLRESAATYGIKPSTASNLWTKYKNILCSGHPPKLSDWGKWLVVRNCLKDCRKPFQQVAQDTGMNISEHVVWDVAADAGYHRRVARKVPFLTALQKRKRTAWANEYKDLNAQQWGDINGQMNAIFTSMTKVAGSMSHTVPMKNMMRTVSYQHSSSHPSM